MTLNFSPIQNPDSIRNGNLGMKTCALMFGVVMAIGMHWKKRKLSIPWRRNQNVITLNQTLLLVVLIYIDNTLLPYYLGAGGRFLFNLEMMRIIVIENLAFKFVFPLLLLRSSRSYLPALWSDREERRLDFFLTPPSYEARPVVFKYQTERRRSKVNKYVTLTVHMSDNNPAQTLTPVD